MSKPTYTRAILKISGESFTSKGIFGIDPDELNIMWDLGKLIVVGWHYSIAIILQSDLLLDDIVKELNLLL